MNLRSDYTLVHINDCCCLLPYGQSITEHRHGITLNASGELLFRALQEGTDPADLPALLAKHYHAGEEDTPMLRADVEDFLERLRLCGILLPDPNDMLYAASVCPASYYKIGTLTVAIVLPDKLLLPQLSDFACTPQAADIHIQVLLREPFQHPTGRVLIRNSSLTILETDSLYVLICCHEGQTMFECHTAKDGSHAVFFCMAAADDTLCELLFSGIRSVYLLAAGKHGLFALHSASILYNGKAWLFAGSAGTGKSTHTSLWNTLFHTPVLNGDLNLIGIDDGNPFVYGMPWCGTSGIRTAKTYPLGGIILLKQHSTDRLFPLSDVKKQLLVMQRLISPTWTKELLCLNLAFAEALCQKAPVWQLGATMEPSAAARMKHVIDTETKEICHATEITSFNCQN